LVNIVLGLCAVCIILLGKSKLLLLTCIGHILVYAATKYFCDFSFKSFKICGTDNRHIVFVSAYMEFNLVRELQLIHLIYLLFSVIE